MTDCNSVSTPTGEHAVGTDFDGAPFQEAWNYRTIIGMLMFLSSNTRPDIAFAIHQVARFSHAPRNSHAVAIKRILRYLHGTADKGFIMNPIDDQRVDCYVDSDFAGLFGSESSHDPVSVKSRTGYVILYRNTPILWVSKLQTQIALSTMEAEYVALSQSTRDLIPIRQLLKEIMAVVFRRTSELRFCTHSKAFADVLAPATTLIDQSTVYEDNHACLKFARMAKLSPQTKHIDIPYQWFRSQIVSLGINIAPIATTNQLADQLTKGLPEQPFLLARFRLMGW